MKNLSVSAGLAFAALLSACDPTFVSKTGQLGFEPAGLYHDYGAPSTKPNPAVVGSVYCPELSGYYDANSNFKSNDELEACFDYAAAGAATMTADGCLAVSGTGNASLELTPRACDVGSFEPDALPFEGVAPTAVELRYDPILQRHDIARLQSSHPNPEVLVPDGRTEIAVAADTTVLVIGGLFVSATGRLATWNHEAFELTSNVGEPEFLPVVDDPELAATLAGFPVGRVRMQAGEAISMTYAASGHMFTSAPIVASGADETASLELVGFYRASVDEPNSVHAIVKDTSGRRVVGAPIAWTIDGPLVQGEDLILARDVLHLEGGCETSEHRAHVRAEYGGQTAHVDFTWSCERVDDGFDPPLFDDDDDDGGAEAPDDDDDVLGCSCRSDEPPGGARAALALIGLMAGRRRRWARAR